MYQPQDAELKVRCYSGHTYAEHPRCFVWKGSTHNVQAVLNEWQEPEGKHFHVRTDNDKLFDLCYDCRTDRWSLKELA